MRLSVPKIVSLLLIMWCIRSSLNALQVNLRQILAIPQRIVAFQEVGQIHTLILSHLTSKTQDYTEIVLQTFCRENITGKGRDPSTDPWGNPYRIWCNRYLFPSTFAVRLGDNDRDKFLIVSAGEDGEFNNRGDIKSRP